MIKLALHMLACFGLFALIHPTPAHAYLDPGTGSLLLQGLAAGLVGVLAFWSRLRRMFREFLNRKKAQ